MAKAEKTISSSPGSHCVSLFEAAPLQHFEPSSFPKRVDQFVAPKDRLWSPSEAAEYLGVSKKTIHALCRRGELEHVTVLRRGDRRFTKEMLDEFVRLKRSQKPVDTKAERGLRSPAKSKKGGEKLTGDSVITQLREEMRSWRSR